MKELGEEMGSAVKCPLESTQTSVQRNTEVSNGEKKKKKDHKDNKYTWDATARLEHLVGSICLSFHS